MNNRFLFLFLAFGCALHAQFAKPKSVSSYAPTLALQADHYYLKPFTNKNWASVMVVNGNDNRLRKPHIMKMAHTLS